MKRLTWIATATLVVLASAIAAPASRAGVDVSFGVNAPVGNDGNLFFSISSRYFDRQPRVVEDWGRRFPNPDDLAVFLQICSRSHQAPEVVFNYRRQGMSWFDVGARVGIPVDFWYVPVAVDPGPPYAKPYKRYKKHGHDSHYAVRLNDREMRDLVAVRMAHEYYGVAPEVAMNWRRDGSSVQVIMTREYRQRHHDDRAYHGHDSHKTKHHDSHKKH
jgi:hypothetical protein